MLKRITALSLIVLSVLALAALAPVNAFASVTAQDTVAPTVVGPTIIVPTVLSTVIVPVTGQPAGTPVSTLLIIGLLVLLGFAIIVGGLAMSRTSHDDVPHDHHH